MADVNPLNETRVLEEYWALQADDVLRGEGIPRGDGRAVIVLPGLFGNDFYRVHNRTGCSFANGLPGLR